MAKRKKSAQLWAARSPDSFSDVDLYSSKPKLNGKCGECGKEVYWTGKVVIDGLCLSEFTRLGVNIKPGEAVQLKLTRVEEAS